MIQAFKDEVGLLVDFPKAGFGNSNFGNTSRRFFGDIKNAATITGIDIYLFHRHKIILETISCGLKADVDKFSKYALDTAKLYVVIWVVFIHTHGTRDFCTWSRCHFFSNNANWTTL